MKRYFYIIVVLAIVASVAGVGSQVYLARNLSDVMITEQTQSGDIGNAEGITFTQMFWDSDSGDEFYRWDITTDASDAAASKVKFTQTKNQEDFDTWNPEASGDISIQPLNDFSMQIGYEDGMDLEMMVQEVLGDFSLYDEEIYRIVKSVADQVDNGDSKTKQITLKDYTDVMPLILSYSYAFNVTFDEPENGNEDVDSAADEIMEGIRDELPRFSLTGEEKVEISVAKNEEGLITELDIEGDDSWNQEVYDCQSVQTDKGLFFTYAGDSDKKTMCVYYIPMKKSEEDDELYIANPEDSCRKLFVTSADEHIETLDWDENSERLLMVTSKGGMNTFASCDPDDLANVQNVELFATDSNDETSDGSDDLETVLYQGDNLWVYVNGSHGLTALQYNKESNRYEVMIDLDCSQAFNQNYLDYYEYDGRTKVAYKDGRLAILYSLNREDSYEMDEDGVAVEMTPPGETALCVLTQDGIGYFGTYHCSLFDDEASYYAVSDNATKEYQMRFE